MTGDGDEQVDVSALVDDLHEQAAALSSDDAAFEELFPPVFMERYTDAATFAAFLAESQWDVASPADFDSVSEVKFGKYVAEHTAFADWAAMLECAGEAWMARRLGV